jgi:predicted DNA-binding transcriptional regulator AlpA
MNQVQGPKPSEAAINPARLARLEAKPTPTYIRISTLSSAPNRPGLLPISKPTVWRWVAMGKFPPPIKLGPQVTVWDMADVNKWLAHRASGVL